jgi:hypothetical protein
MPRKSLLLLLPISFLLIVAPIAKADSINNLTQLDSGNSFTLYALDYRGWFPLMPNSIVHGSADFCRGCLVFAATIPAGWTFGGMTFSLSFDGRNISGSPGVGPCPPDIRCVGFGFAGSFPSAKTPATLTFLFPGPNGGTETANFFVSDTTPEPPTLILFGTGGILLGGICRYRVRPAGRIL